MQRTTEYRGFAIRVDLLNTPEGMFDTWFQIKGPVQACDAVYGARLKVFGSPFSRRWAHLVGELAGRASIDQSWVSTNNESILAASHLSRCTRRLPGKVRLRLRRQLCGYIGAPYGTT